MTSRGPAPSARVPLPREHGAWVMLYAPLLVPLLAWPSARLLHAFCLWLAATGGFCLQHVGGLLLRGRGTPHQWCWFGVFLLLFLAGSLPLLLAFPMRDLLPLALPAGAMFALKGLLSVTRPRNRFERTFWGEILGVVALTLTGPGASLIARGKLDGTAWLVWACMILFFASGVFWVNLLLAASRPAVRLNTAEKWRLGRMHLLYHAALLLVAAGAVASGGPGAALLVIAYAPIILRAVVGWIRLDSRIPPLKRVGQQELLYTVWFVGFLAAWLRAAAWVP